MNKSRFRQYVEEYAKKHDLKLLVAKPADKYTGLTYDYIWIDDWIDEASSLDHKVFDKLKET